MTASPFTISTSRIQTDGMSPYSSENQEKEDKPKEEEVKEPAAEEKPRVKSSQPKEASPAFMSTIFAVLDVYMTKMLVSLLQICWSSRPQ